MILYLYIIAFTEKAVLLQEVSSSVGENLTFEIVTNVNITAPLWYIVSNFIRILTFQSLIKRSNFFKAVFSTTQFNIKLMMILISIGIQAFKCSFPFHIK